MENNIRFSTHPNPNKSKSKAMYVVGPRGGAHTQPVPLVLCGQALPWVERCEHLGHTLTQDGTMIQDSKEKRATFIDQTTKTRETFNFAHPLDQIEATEKYCTSMYGSNLWNLSSEGAGMIFSAWRTNIKLAWDVP